MLKKTICLCFLFITVVAIANEELRDPTKPFGAPKNPMPEINAQIDEILVGKQNSFVMIAGQRLKVGDKLLGGEIIVIRLHEVVIRDASGEYTIKMLNQVIKQPSAKKIN